jgi:hypothetical protein
LRLNFNIEKAKAAAAYLIERSGGSVDMFFLIKMLYYADRTALVEWGNSITGDSFASLRKGPIVSDIYNFLKDPVPRPLQGPEEAEWRQYFGKKGNGVSLLKTVDTDVLSDRELEVLERSRKIIKNLKNTGNSVAEWLHENCPEWEDPGGGSLPIDPATILRNAGRTEKEIDELDRTNKQVQLLTSMISAR